MNDMHVHQDARAAWGNFSKRDEVREFSERSA